MEYVVKEQINDFKSIHHLDQSEHSLTTNYRSLLRAAVCAHGQGFLV